MLVLLSPSKALNFDPVPGIGKASIPTLLKQSQELIDQARELSVEELKKLMSLSDKLAQLNHQRFANFSVPFTKENAKQAILAFNGDVYDGLDAASFNKEDFTSAQERIRILSGLYGLIRPFDFIQPYRLEMGCRMKNSRGKNLYEFWGDIITDELNNSKGSDLIINLASNEYFKAVNTKKLNGKLVAVNFKEKKDGKYKIIGIFAKRARGMMARHIVKNKVNDVSGLVSFDADGYLFNMELSTENEIIFTR